LFVSQSRSIQKDAASLAASGVGSYKPFLTSAQQALTTAEGLTGSQAYKQFMSPYQQDVIDATLQDFDRQAAMQRQNVSQRAMQAGAFGGARQGVAEAEYDAASDRNRSSILSGLLQTGFGQAQQAAQQAFSNQGALAQAQQGLGQFLPQAQRADIQTLGAVGGIQQSQAQAGLDAQRQAAQTAAYEPFQRLNVFGSGVTGLMGGMQNFGDVIKTQPDASPLQSALGIGTSVAGILGALR
jgi:ATP/maltotriose-dependent transcriptional regulator MalT